MFVVAYKGLPAFDPRKQVVNEWKPCSRVIHSRYDDAVKDMERRVRESAPELASRYRIMDAEDFRPGDWPI